MSSRLIEYNFSQVNDDPHIYLENMIKVINSKNVIKRKLIYNKDNLTETFNQMALMLNTSKKLKRHIQYFEGDGNIIGYIDSASLIMNSTFI